MAGGLGVVCSGRCGVGTGQEWYALVFGLVVWALGRSGMRWSLGWWCGHWAGVVCSGLWAGGVGTGQEWYAVVTQCCCTYLLDQFVGGPLHSEC